VRYSFLWSSEARAGRAEGRKDRPCVIVIAIRRAGDGRFRVRVLPITHAPTEEARSIAEQMSDPDSKQMMLRIAEDYERLAAHARRRMKGSGAQS